MEKAADRHDATFQKYRMQNKATENYLVLLTHQAIAKALDEIYHNPVFAISFCM